MRKIRFTHFGEGDYEDSERKIQELLKETGSSVGEIPLNNTSYEILAGTPETYLGANKIDNFASPEQINTEKESNYSIPQNIGSNQFAYGGKWTVGKERAAPSIGSFLKLNFVAKEVFLVTRPKNGIIGKIKVYIDNNPADKKDSGADVSEGIVTVNEDRLYKLINLQNPGRHILKLEFLDNNLELYAFTFG